jgi:protein-arginine kinase
MNLSIHEQFKDVEKQKTKKEMIAKLQQYLKESKAMAIILDLTFNSKIKWLLPPGLPPYNPTDHIDSQNVLKNEARKLQYFINTREGLAMKPLRRETMFIELLESVDKHDAKLLISIKDGKFPYNGITKKLVQEAIPDQTQNW